MKKLLVITYYWPPSAGSGVQRWLKMSKYLPENGWQPIIYTPENPDFDTKDKSLLNDIPESAIVIKTKINEPYRLYRLLTGKKEGSNFGMTKSAKPSITQRLSLWARGNLFIPDPRVIWRGPSLRYLKKYLKKNPVDAIVTTGPPQSMHLIGLGLKKHFPEIPWISDFRDPWSKFDFLENFNLTEKTLNKYRNLERKVLANADRVVVVSPSLADELEEFDHSKARVVNNGFDHVDFEEKRTSHSSRFSIYHAGLINAYRYYPALWEVLDNLVQENDQFAAKLKIELVGNITEDVRLKIYEFEALRPHINFRTWIAHDELMQEYCHANMLLLLPHQSVNAKGIIPGKLYEYLALKKPILNLGPINSDLAKIIKDTKTGVTYSGKDKLAIENKILEVFDAFQNQEEFNPDEVQINLYSRKVLAQKFATVLDEIT